MRFTKRLLAFVLMAVMLVSTCIIGTASATYSQVSTADMNGAVYTELRVKGTYKTADAHLITFNPADGVIPMAYSGSAGKAMTVDKHVAAAIAEGYEVLGAINGGYFDMSTGDPLGTVISGGRLLFYHRMDESEEILTTFGVDGAANLVYSNLKLTVAFNGANVSDSNSIGVFNKDYTIVSNEEATISALFHYYDSKAGNLANSAQSGVEILCEVQDGTVPAIGETLKGKIISVNRSSYYGKLTSSGIADNQFVIFTKNSGNFISSTTSLSAGDTVDLTIQETNVGAKSYMQNALSAIHSTYWLAHTFSGTYEDLTDPSDAFIGHDCHKYGRGWTIFGWDQSTGSYGFLVSEEPDWGNGIDLADATDVLHNKTGVNAILRLDGGGSSVMYANGKMVYSNEGRAVSDCILIIRRPAKYGLEEKLAEAEAANPGDYSEAGLKLLRTAYASALAVYNNTSSKEADYKTALNNLTTAMTNAANDSGDKVTDYIWVNTVDERITMGKTGIITADMAVDGVVDVSNTKWSYVLRLEPNADGQYEVIEKLGFQNASAKSLSLTGDQILIGVYKNNAQPASVTNRTLLEAVQVGDVITEIKGLDIENGTYSVGAYIKLPATVVEEPDNSEPVEDESSEPVEESSEPVEDETSEPVEESSEPVEDETSEPIEDESSEPVDETSEPDSENSQPDDVSDDKSDDVSDDKSDNISDDKSDDVSDDKSDDTSDDNSDDNSEPGDNNEEPEDYVLGDINGNGLVDSLDYILLKRAYFNTFALNDIQSKAGDINGNGIIDSLDYILLKRAYFGTYKLSK